MRKRCLPTILAAISLLLPSCAQFFVKDHGFRKTPSVELNSAQVRSSVKAMGGKGGISVSAMVYGASVGTLDGPFLWRIEAEGTEGVHEWLRVNEVYVTTKTTKRNERFPRNLLGTNAKFKPIPGEKGKSFAKFQIPGKLTVMPRTDGAVKIKVNVTISASGKTKSEWITFELEPESKRRTESIFLPVEIVKGIRGNPREWDW